MDLARQSFLDERADTNTETSTKFLLLTWNVRNPSWTTATVQARQLLARFPADVFVLTELKNRRGALYHMDRLRANGYRIFPTAPSGEYQVLVASRVQAQPMPLDAPLFSSRIVGIILAVGNIELKLLGLYGPSRWPITRKYATEKRFQDEVRLVVRHIESQYSLDHTIVTGDLNVIERGHVPHYADLLDWEYDFYDFFLETGLVDAYHVANPSKLDHSWYGIGGDGPGYRLDHMFMSRDLAKLLTECYYVHDFRRTGLSDHSALALTMDLSKTNTTEPV